MATDISNRIRDITQPSDLLSIKTEIQTHLDRDFSDLDVLLGHAGSSRGEGTKRGAQRRKKGLKDEINLWEEREAAAEQELEATTGVLPGLLEATQTKLQVFLSSGQELSLQRYAIADRLANLVGELTSGSEDLKGEGDGEGGAKRKRQGETVLEQMEMLHGELARLEAGLGWVTVLEQVMLLSEKALSPKSQVPSPLAALPHVRGLYELVSRTEATLPAGMSLLRIIVDIRDKTWRGLKDVMSRNLIQACEAIKWPLKVSYDSTSPHERRAFERAYQDLLYLQAEGEDLGVDNGSADWSAGNGLYSLQAMVEPIALRFKYHFQGSRSTNRIDKPEWAFENILNQIYEHQVFLQDYIQPLTSRAGYEVDIKSEFILHLLPIPLALLRARIPRLLEHPALLAHTVYQTVIFDNAIRDHGFDLGSTSLYEGNDSAVGEWEGLAGVVLKEDGWFDQWLAGEKKFADKQLEVILFAPVAWDISEETLDEDESQAGSGSKSTVSARQVKALVDQIIDRYQPLPSIDYTLPFLLTLHLPLVNTYLSRISSSLDAFESIAAAFVRSVPGALAGNTRGGVHFDQAKLTHGKPGLERLIKGWLSCSWMLDALGGWSDDLFFVEMASQLREASHLRWKLQGDTLLPPGFRSALSHGDLSGATVFDVLIDKHEQLALRTEDMIVRLVTSEVEGELRPHLTRRWDRTTEQETEIDSSLLSSLTTLSLHLSTIHKLLPLTLTLRLYRRISTHITNHISQRSVYSGWSKFSALGGQDFTQEVKEWVQTCLAALPGVPGVETPWKRLEDVGRILSLTSENIEGEGDGWTFAQAMKEGWEDGEGYRKVLDGLGVGEMNRGELQGVLRRRAECWR